MPHPVFLIIGYPQNGKTEVSKILSRRFGLIRGSTSDVIYRLYAEEMAAQPIPGVDLPASVDACEKYLRSLPKEEIRSDLVRVGDAFVKDAPARIVTALVDRGCCVIDGIRRRPELILSKTKLQSAGHKVRVLWVEGVPAPPKINDNTTVTHADADIVVLNTFSGLEQLEKVVLGLIQLP